MDTVLMKEVAAACRREAAAGQFNMHVWFKTEVPTDQVADDDVGHNLTEAAELQEFFDRLSEDPWVAFDGSFKSCSSAACAAGTTLWVAMGRGEQFFTGSIENRASQLLDLPAGCAEHIFRMTDCDGFQIAEVLDGLADGTIRWNGDAGTYGLVWGDAPEIAVTDADLDHLGALRRHVDDGRKVLIANARRRKVLDQADLLDAQADDLHYQARRLREELETQDQLELVDAEPF